MSLVEERVGGGARACAAIWEEVNGCESLEFIKGPTFEEPIFYGRYSYGSMAWIVYGLPSVDVGLCGFTSDVGLDFN